MDVETTDVAAESSTAAATDVPAEPQQIDLSALTPEQRQTWRKTGELPKPKTEKSAAPAKPAKEASATESSEEGEEGESASESETGKESTQEPRKGKNNAESRIRELLAENKRLKAERGTSPAKAKEDGAPAPAEKPQPQFTRPKPKAEDVDKDGKPKYANYDDYLEELSDWKTEQKLAEYKREQTQAAQQKELEGKLADGRKRYENLDEVIKPVADQLFSAADIAPAVKAIINDSPVLVDLLYVLGSKADDLADFVQTAKTNPSAAIRKAVLLERLVMEELAKGKESGKDGEQPDKGKAKPPEKPKTNAPPPPREVGGRGTTPGDPLMSAAQAKDFRSFKTEANRRALARGK